jgi:uncharacterized protein (TIGR02147 family)
MKETRTPIPSVYEFTDFRGFLRTYFESKKRESRAFSTRRWSRDLGVSSPATLNMVLTGKRNPGPQLVDRLTRYFSFSKPQKQYFETLVKLAKVKDSPELSVNVLADLRDLHPKKEIREIPYDLFEAISSWYCLAIREMSQSHDFEEKPEWIAQKLKGRVSPAKVAAALRTLESAGLLSRGHDRRLKPAEMQIGTLADKADEAIKRFHEQTTQLALESIRTAPVSLRDFGGSTFNMDPADLPSLKADLRQMRREIYQRYEKISASATFQLNVQLFPLTEIKE